MSITRLFFTSLAVVGLASATCAEPTVSAATSKQPTVAAQAVYAVVTVYIRNGKEDAYSKIMQDDVKTLAHFGLKLVGSYAVRYGTARYIDIWEAPSMEALRRASSEYGPVSPEILNVVEREEVEIADRLPVDPLPQGPHQP